MEPCSKIERKIGRLTELNPINKEHILRFVSHLKANNISEKRILKYIHHIGMAASWIEKDFLDTDKIDIEAIVTRINEKDFADWTKSDSKIMLKVFFKWLEGEGEFYPKKVFWIKGGMVKNKILPEELLTPEEVKAMINACDGIKGRAFISMLYEGALRIGEITPMRIKHVEPNGYGISVTVPNMGKTGLRRVLLINSVPFISNWMAHHPDRDNPEAPLWVCESNWGKKGKLISYTTFSKMLKNAKGRMKKHGKTIVLFVEKA